MNRTKIEWCDYSWGIVRGCLHNCHYCYGKGFARRFNQGNFSPTFYPEKLQEPLKVKKPAKIFVGSMADLFGSWGWFDGETEIHPGDVIDGILNTVKQCPQHTFIFLTKNPRGMQGFDFPDNCWCGTSVENQEKADERIPELLKVKCKTRFVSLEPILGPVDFYSDVLGDPLCRCDGCMDLARSAPEMWQAQRIDWLIIGAQTGPGAIKPEPRWIAHAMAQAMNADVPVFAKDNLGPIPVYPRPREWPKGAYHETIRD